jgi:hypothetical protein
MWCAGHSVLVQTPDAYGYRYLETSGVSVYGHTSITFMVSKQRKSGYFGTLANLEHVLMAALLDVMLNLFSVPSPNPPPKHRLSQPDHSEKVLFPPIFAREKSGLSG